MNEIRTNIANFFINLRGWRTNRHIIVIESDDWGSIRMPSREVYDKCLKAGYPVNKNEYEQYDSLLSEDDLEVLFGVLTSFKDRDGTNPIITANCVVANPDFDKIKADNYNRYHFELITETFKRYPNHSGNFKLWAEAIDKKILFPQYHCREHLNVSLFMDALVRGDPDVHFGFENMMPGCIIRKSGNWVNPYVEALRYSTKEDKRNKLSIFLNGLDIFEILFGFRSESIIPPNFLWSPDFNKDVVSKGVKYIQGRRKMVEPNPDGNDRYHVHNLGQVVPFGLKSLVRNVLFEPSMYRLYIKDPVDRCLNDISIAFSMKKPAIISSHRLNYVGFIDKKNRDRTIKMLEEILRISLLKWPKLEFMNSAQLARMMK